MQRTFDVFVIDNSKVNEEDILANLSRKEKPSEAMQHKLND